MLSDLFGNAFPSVHENVLALKRTSSVYSLNADKDTGRMRMYIWEPLQVPTQNGPNFGPSRSKMTPGEAKLMLLLGGTRVSSV